MAYVKRAPRHDWRKSLTTDEATRVGEIEARVAAIVRERFALSAELRMLRNRASKRPQDRVVQARPRRAAA